MEADSPDRSPDESAEFSIRCPSGENQRGTSACEADQLGQFTTGSMLPIGALFSFLFPEQFIRKLIFSLGVNTFLTPVCVKIKVIFITLRILAGNVASDNMHTFNTKGLQAIYSNLLEIPILF